MIISKKKIFFRILKETKITISNTYNPAPIEQLAKPIDFESCLLGIESRLRTSFINVKNARRLTNLGEENGKPHM